MRKRKGFHKPWKALKFFQPDGNPDPRWKVYLGATLNGARDRAVSATWYAAQETGNGSRDVALEAAQKAIEAALERAGRGPALAVARSIVQERTWFTAREAARYATENTVSSVVQAASLAAAAVMASDLDFEGKDTHLAHARERWNVCQKGYGLLGDVGSILYAFARDPSAPVEQNIEPNIFARILVERLAPRLTENDTEALGSLLRTLEPTGAAVTE